MYIKNYGETLTTKVKYIVLLMFPFIKIITKLQ